MRIFVGQKDQGPPPDLKRVPRDIEVDERVSTRPPSVGVSKAFRLFRPRHRVADQFQTQSLTSTRRLRAEEQEPIGAPYT
jgi:hypothetical protein